MHAKVIELEKIKVGAVSYLNTKPLLYGIKRSEPLLKIMELVESYPSKIAAMLIDGSIDMGLVPVAVLPQLKEGYIVSDYCIGADGDVASVCLFSQVPLEKIQKVLLDYQSSSSVQLCKLLLKNFWKIEPLLEDAAENFENNIGGTTAAVIIGDRALAQRKISPFIYDLAGAWKAFTGLPFVFAAWVANKKLPDDFIALFNGANTVGLNNMDTVIAENASDMYDLKKYYTKNISYTFDERKKKGMAKFLQIMNEI